jgi:phosphatidylinositol alpha-mannosyltransferase
MHRLRIAQVTEYYYPHLGGICEHVHFLAREARLRGHHVDIITSNLTGAEESPDVIRVGRSVPVYSNGSMARVTVGANLRRDVREVLARGEYDIVHVHAPLAPTLPMLAADEATCPVIGTFHTYFEYSVCYSLAARYFQRRLSRLAAAVAVSPTVVEAHSRYFDTDWTLIPNGVDTQLFSPDAPRPISVRADMPSILFLGRFDPRNGLATLIDAFQRIRGPNRPRKRIVGTSRSIPRGAGALGWKTSVSMPFGMICQSASKYRLSATVVLLETAIAAESMSRRFWKNRRPSVYPTERSK